MTGPDHYRKAEDLLSSADLNQLEPGSPAERSVFAEAQVHATLALAAATAELTAYGMNDGSATGRTETREMAWSGVLDGLPARHYIRDGEGES